MFPDTVTRLQSKTILWRGKIKSENQTGYAVFTTKLGMLAGTIIVGAATFEIVPIPNQPGFARLMRIETTLLPPEATPLTPIRGTKHLVDEHVEQPSKGKDLQSPEIDVLLVYTSSVKDELGGEEETEIYVENMISTANAVYQNSDMNVTLDLAGVYETNYSEAAVPMEQQLRWLDNDPDVANARLVNEADLVAMLTTEQGGYCGIAWLMGKSLVGPQFAQYAFSVTALSCVANLTFVHEVGHNMGMEHDPTNGNPPNLASFPYSYGHYVNGDFRTIMSYAEPCVNGCPRQLRISNPDVYYHGFSTGIAGERDNARTGDNTAPIIENFSNHLPRLPLPVIFYLILT